MKYVILSLIVVIFSQSCKREPSKNLIVEGYLFANKHFDTLRIAKVIPDDRPFFTEPVTGAKVVIRTSQKDFYLLGLENHPGIYYYPGNDFIVQPNITYYLDVDYKLEYLSAHTTIPNGSSNPILSGDTLSTAMANDSIANLSWTPKTNYSFIVRKYMLNNPLSNPSFSSSNMPYYLQRPFKDNAITLKYNDFPQLGNYDMIVYQVNDDFFKLFQASNLNPGVSPVQLNIWGGNGIFTGIYTDTVKLVIR